jgi:hypothetical protein
MNNTDIKNVFGKSKGYIKLSELLNEDGSPNWTRFDEIFDDYFNKVADDKFAKGRYNLRTRPEHHDGESNTREHIENVVNSVLKSNVSANIKSNLIIAAMLHDIAKPFRRGNAHGLDAMEIINEIFSESEESNLIKLAVRHHMFSDTQSEFTLDEAKKIINDAVNLNVNINEFIELLLALNSADIIRNRDLSVIDSYTNKPLLDTVKEEYEFKKRLLQQAIDIKNSETIAENKRKIYD